jgi:hypothetical protein
VIIFYSLRFETSLFLASYDSQGHGGGIGPRLHTGWTELLVLFSSQRQSYVTTDGQSASLTWNKAPIWGVRLDFYYCQTVTGLLMWSALSDERTALSFIIAAGTRQRSHSWVRVPLVSWPYFTVSYSRLTNLEGQVPVFISPRTRWPSYTLGHLVPFWSPQSP